MTDRAKSPQPAGHSTSRRLWAELFRPVDIAWLVAVRVSFGILLGVSMQRFLAYGWVDRLLLEPHFHFKYWGFEWVEPLPPSAMHALFWVLSALGFCVAAGFAFRLAAIGLALGFTYVQLIDVTTYLNHYYLACLLAWLLAVSPAGKAWSVDAWLTRSRATDAGLEQVAAAWHYLFRVQIGLVYTFAGIAKAQSDWLLHGQPLRIWLGANTNLPVLGELFTLDAVPLLMSWFGFLFDISIVWWLLYSKTRPWAYLVVIAFHLGTKLLFNIGMFPFIMASAALVFFPASWPRDLLRRLGLARLVPARAGAAPTPPRDGSVDAHHRPVASVTRWHKVAATLGLGYCLVQLALPLRHLLYDGNVLWHEQGMRFSWKVMVRVKGGGTTFQVRDKNTDATWQVSPDQYLTPMQEAEMSSQPDLIVQLAHHIRDDFASRGVGPVEVFAESRATLNGRRLSPLIDPTIDLAQIRDGLARADWILAAPTVPPPHTRPIR